MISVFYCFFLNDLSKLPMMDDRLLRYGPYTHATSQTNKCGNYWFPINVLCSNINPQIEGDENSIAVTSAQEDGNVESTKNLGAPFP
jgi:hypothetical protein